MKTQLRKLAALLLSLALLAGCAPAEALPADDPSAPQDQSQPEADPAAEPEEDPAAQTFTLPYEPDAGLDPYNCTSLSNRTVLSLVYEPLFSVDAEFHAVPYLVKSYAASGDGQTHTIMLRTDVTFSDGSPLRAADAAASIRSAQASTYYGQRLRHITAVTAASDSTLTITTDVPCGTLDLLLNIPVSKNGRSVGTGPYRLSGSQLQRTDWWRVTEPPVTQERIRLTEISDAAQLRDSFEYGLIDLVCADPNAGVRAAYHADYELWSSNTTILQYVGFNLESPVFVYSSLRAAVTYIIDRETMVSDVAGGFASASVLPASPHSPLYDQKLADNYAYNPTAFEAALLASEIRDMDGDGTLDVYNETGFQPLTGTMIVCSNSEQRVSAAQAVVDALNAKGFDLTLKALEYNEYVYALRTGNFDLYYGEVRLSPDFDLSAFFAEGGSLSYGGIADSALELLCAQALENTGNAYDLHQKIMERGLLCPVLFKTYAIYAARGCVSELSPCLDGVFTLPMEP